MLSGDQFVGMHGANGVNLHVLDVPVSRGMRKAKDAVQGKAAFVLATVNGAIRPARKFHFGIPPANLDNGMKLRRKSTAGV